MSGLESSALIAKARAALHESKKLLLVLDIDHTLVHCTKDERAEIIFKDPVMRKEVHKMYFQETEDKPYYLKLRPFIKPFLETLSQFYHLAVYTMGGKAYALKVMKLIDPNNKILKGRLVCRDDHPNDNRKILQRMFPCDERMVLVVDDRTDVWTTPLNVLKVYKYDFWPSDAGDDDDLMSPMEGKKETPDEVWTLDLLKQKNHDNILGTTANVLQSIHRVYFHDPSLYMNLKMSASVIYHQLKKRVFHGVHIVFSGVFPSISDPRNAEEWKLSEEYGATCHTELSDEVTHVVSARAGTAKVHRARKMDVYVIHINWLRQSIIHFVRMFEPDFPIGSKVRPRPISANCSRPVDIIELSDFLLDKKKAPPRVCRPSELHMPELDQNSSKFDRKKYEKYRYLAIQRRHLLLDGKVQQQAVKPPAVKNTPKAISTQKNSRPEYLAPVPSIPSKKLTKSISKPTQPTPLMPTFGTAPLMPTPNNSLQTNQIQTSLLVPRRRARRRPKELTTNQQASRNNLKVPAYKPKSTQSQVYQLQKKATKPQKPNFQTQQKAPKVQQPVIQTQFQPLAGSSPFPTSVQPPGKKITPPRAPKKVENTLEERVKEEVVKFLKGKFWTPTEIIYVHLRKRFSMKSLRNVGLSNPEKYYSGVDTFRTTKAQNRILVRYSSPSSRRNFSKMKKRAGDSLDDTAPPRKRKKVSGGESRERSPIPSFEKSLISAHSKREKMYKDLCPEVKKNTKTKKRKPWPNFTRGEKDVLLYGPPGQERALHPLNPKDLRSKSRCKFFKEGSCLKKQCPFLHHEAQLYLRPPNDEWKPLSLSDYKNKSARNRKSPRNEIRRKNQQLDDSFLSSEDDDYFSEEEYESSPDDDFASLLQQHLKIPSKRKRQDSKNLKRRPFKPKIVEDSEEEIDKTENKMMKAAAKIEKPDEEPEEGEILSDEDS